MRIAVPTDDGLSISEHFGRSAAFLVFEAVNAEITSREMRKNQGLQARAQSSCGEDRTGLAQPHSHTAILSSIAGCDTVICAGMGWRAAEALRQAGIDQVIVTESGPAKETVQEYLKGEISAANQPFCRCSH